MAAVAADNRNLFTAHPWAAEVATGRPPLGPGQMARYEYELRAFDDTGLDDVARDAVVDLRPRLRPGRVPNGGRGAVRQSGQRLDR
ncbi:hypothetical protein Vlu01_37480 [Micromonospora lutea]|uniref:Tetracycline repressor TetR C-terminal domain-containing protein n=1 Tax=Micromonospora lutea TaxID=419825 RepID=A0ABQ4IYX9_9ACTN|nr:TetR/AcrR family transcriptional regulator C-terminal domain-containing protein [Micromonospora lutea]GIJ23124.1 hypothetical protein Vlu01_37480 [Micromonospora lutea]